MEHIQNSLSQLLLLQSLQYLTPCYFYTAWSLWHKTSFQLSHLAQVMRFCVVCLLLFYFRTSAFILPATGGLIRLNHWSSILSFKCTPYIYTLKVEHLQESSFSQFICSCFITTKSIQGSEKKNPTNYYSWTGRTARTIGE